MAASSVRSPYPLERVKGYSDGVFAIAATLLVLDLTTDAFGTVTSDAGMWEALADGWPHLLAFLVSFLLLSLVWMIHVRQFRDIVRADSVLVWLNNLRLLFVVLIPFTTSVNSLESDFVAGRLLLPLNFFLVSVMSLLSYLWAASGGGRLLADDARADTRSQVLGGVAAVTAGAIAVALSPFIGSFAFLAYVLNPPLQALLVRSSRRRPAASEGGGGRG